MSFLLNHWHCVLPIVGIIVAGFLMRDNPNNKGNNESEETVYGSESKAARR